MKIKQKSDRRGAIKCKAGARDMIRRRQGEEGNMGSKKEMGDSVRDKCREGNRVPVRGSRWWEKCAERKNITLNWRIQC